MQGQGQSLVLHFESSGPSLVLTDEDLNTELLAMTDHFTDELFSSILKVGGTLFVNQSSRLVMDPERFPDDLNEPMSTLGMGAQA